MKKLPKDVYDFIYFTNENYDIPCEIDTLRQWSELLLNKYDRK